MSDADRSRTRNDVSGTIDRGVVFQAQNIHIGVPPDGQSAQAEVVRTQRELIETALALNKVQRQLVDSAAAERRTSNIAVVLQTVVFRLSMLIGQLTNDRDSYAQQAARYEQELKDTVEQLATAYRERDRATAQLKQARTERQRAGAVAEANQDQVVTLARRLDAASRERLADSPEGHDLGTDAPTSDDILEDTVSGLDRMQRLLDEQDDRLSRLESATTVDSADLSVLRDVVYRSLAEAWGNADWEDNAETVTISSGAYKISITEPDPGGRVRASITAPSGRAERFVLDFGNNPRTLRALTRASSATVVESDDDGKINMDVDGMNVVAEINLRVADGTDDVPQEFGIEFGPESA